ncbi:MAG: hypothetical protein LBB05_03595 [Puniceicoccales bacterium]|nr:hypothetical protein [Puniceicoccales bacterium]
MKKVFIISSVLLFSATVYDGLAATASAAVPARALAVADRDLAAAERDSDAVRIVLAVSERAFAASAMAAVPANAAMPEIDLLRRTLANMGRQLAGFAPENQMTRFQRFRRWFQQLRARIGSRRESSDAA